MITYELGNKNLALYEELFECLKDDILSGKISGKLPSKRALANHLNISVTTVMSAYSELLAQGFIYSVPKKGYFVSSGVLVLENQKSQKPLKLKNRQKELINLSSPNLEFLNFPFSTWRKLMRENSLRFLQSVPYKGSFELRAAICKHLNAYLGLKTKPDLVIVGAGTEYLYTLIAQLLGTDKIYATEDPNHLKIRQIYESLGAKCLSLNTLDESNLKQVSYLHISPTNHFPTGKTLSIKTRLKLVNWANKENKFIIEDNFLGEINLSGRAISPLKNLAPNGVIYMSTFSKTLLPTLRISYMVLPENLMSEFEKRLSFYSSTVPIFEQLTLAKFIDDGYFERYLNRLKKLYKTKKAELLIKLTKFEDKFSIRNINSGSAILINFKKSDDKIREIFKNLGYKINFTGDYYWVDTNQDKPSKSSAILDFLSIEIDTLMKVLKSVI
ncbi:PLP-dependent aminotransferase family protein [Campylobacter corcagiensis]|uniref:PLP-dependent aminotransferase family protein n=1 Tax=Campylobacter corcagiensis TaxID=1448857 RepID=A0A7M1LFP5_9BACT|nr:PLP-dependent aminotransferase family protein [Campylobacter corcagiensis]QKF64395.1 transcriptional regulator, MerR family [Campylobacter corcagiensis]QOQ87419.1 PLP-dependent aminotransferase family protein [Campylobacter corcagiensis]